MEEESRISGSRGKPYPLRILMAEDNITDQIIAAEILKQSGYKADVARNGLEVLEALHRQDYDVVLMDIQMPEMDGITTAREIGQRLPADRRPWMVAMTADTGEEDRRSYFEAGMNDFIAKPILKQDWSAVLSRIPTKKPVTASSEIKPPEAMPRGPLLDTAALKRLKDTLGTQADAMFPALLEDFIKDGDRLLQDAQRALDQKNFPDLRRAAHTLKSNGATFGAMALSSAAKELEALAKQGIAEGAPAFIKRSQEEFEKAKIELGRYRKGI